MRTARLAAVDNGRGPTDMDGRPAVPKITAGFSGPVQTNDWWSSLIWKYYSGNPYSENMYAHPLAFHAQANGMGMGYPAAVNITGDGKMYEFMYAEDLRVGISGLNAPDARTERYSDWTVTASQSDGARTLLTTMGHGLPFAYFKVSGGSAAVTPAGPATIWHNSGGVVGLTVRGHHYGIFGPAASSWSGSGVLTSTLAGKDYLSVALLPDNTPATLEFFRQRAYAFVDSSEVSWTYDEATGRLATTYRLRTTLKESGLMDRPLMALYRHQWQAVSDALTAYRYVSPRGEMRVLDGSSFTTSVSFSGVLPNLPQVATTDAPRLRALVDEVYAEAQAGPLPDKDTYFGGKDLCRYAMLVPIAEQVGNLPARDLLLRRVREK
ncbi:MAG: hypothetical protein FJX76_18420, partial [Armatimonadetes bacterium]|nr:hypothetical protein [Armatimonadota bacterium]